MDETKIIDLSKFSKHNPDKLELSEEDELVNMGVEVFNDAIQDTVGFLAVMINEEGTPQIVWAGNVDTISALGSIEIAKQIFLEKALYGSGDELDFIPDA